MQCSQQMNPRTGCANQHVVGNIALDDGSRFTDRKIGRRFSDRDLIAGASQVVVDRYVTGWHIGQVLQQPQWIDLTNAVFSPSLGIKLVIIIQTMANTPVELCRLRNDIVSSKHGAITVRVVDFR